MHPREGETHFCLRQIKAFSLSINIELKKKKKIINYFIIQGLIKSPEYDCIIIDYSVPKGRHLQEKVFRLNTNLITVDLKEKKKKIRVNIPL